jgi:hypothetical protein
MKTQNFNGFVALWLCGFLAFWLFGFLAFWQDFVLVLLAIVFSKIRCARFWRAAKATRYFYFFDNVRYNILLPPRPSPTSFAT